MTAGPRGSTSVTQGIVQGTYRDLRRGRPPSITAAISPGAGSHRRSAAWAAPSRWRRRWRARPASRWGKSGASRVASSSACARLSRRRRRTISRTRWRAIERACAERRAIVGGPPWSAMPPRRMVFPELVFVRPADVRPDAVTPDQDLGPRPGERLPPQGLEPRDTRVGTSGERAYPPGTAKGRQAVDGRARRGDAGLGTAWALPTLDYGNNIRQNGLNGRRACRRPSIPRLRARLHPASGCSADGVGPLTLVRASSATPGGQLSQPTQEEGS